MLCIYTENGFLLFFEALKHQNCLIYNNHLWKQLCSCIFCTIPILNTDKCFPFIFGVVKHYWLCMKYNNHLWEGNMSGRTKHVESIHSNFISWNHWSALTVWGDKTNHRISQIWSLFYHHISTQDVHPRIRSTGQCASQQYTCQSGRRGVCGEWHLTLPLRKGYCSAD